MALSVGIVGLPNVGKSTLFNAITNSQVPAQNYPFCTIDPSTGVVPINDPRLAVLSKISNTATIIPAAIEFTDIAGLVKGASKGEGLGNKFLTHIREVSAICHVVRCFDDQNIVHVSGAINPLDDIEIINLELILADLEMAEKMIGTMEKKMRSTKEQAAHDRFNLLKKMYAVLADNKALRHMDLTPEEVEISKGFNFLSLKKVIYVANVSEDQIGRENEYVCRVKEKALAEGDEFAVISARIEEEISMLDDESRSEYLKELGLECSGLDLITKKCFSLLGLQTYLTTGEKETRAWTIHKGDTAPVAAGVIHTDFERGFIRANIVKYEDFVAQGGWKGAREKGLMRQEGKTYIMQDGDIVEFLFNV